MRRRSIGEITSTSFVEPVDPVAEADRHQFRALSSPLLNALAYCIVFQRDSSAIDTQLEAAEDDVPEVIVA